MSIDEREFRRMAEMVKENNKMLHKMRRHAVAGTVMRTVYYTFIIATAIGAYYYLRPLIEVGRESVGNIIDSVNSIRGAADGFSSIGETLQGVDIEAILNQAGQ